MSTIYFRAVNNRFVEVPANEAHYVVHDERHFPKNPNEMWVQFLAGHVLIRLPRAIEFHPVIWVGGVTHTRHFHVIQVFKASKESGPDLMRRTMTGFKGSWQLSEEAAAWPRGNAGWLPSSLLGLEKAYIAFHELGIIR